MPIQPSSYPTDRRAASSKRDSDVSKQPLPVVTKTAYMESFRKADDMNQKMRSLCVGRIRTQHALMAIDKAMHDWNPAVTKNGLDAGVYNKLRSIRVQIEKVFLKYPLKIQP